MEFHEKLQYLRKQKGLTQEQLAQALYVSRAAVSKWESGRGYPNIDSLKLIAAFYCVTVDELLSGEELLTIAEDSQKQTAIQLCSLIIGLLDLSAVMFLFLPLFRQQEAGIVQAVSLLSLTGTAPYLKSSYILMNAVIILTGILKLALQNCNSCFWTDNREKISLLFHVLGTLLFIISFQPYAAALSFLLLGIKVFLLIKMR